MPFLLCKRLVTSHLDLDMYYSFIPISNLSACNGTRKYVRMAPTSSAPMRLAVEESHPVYTTDRSYNPAASLNMFLRKGLQSSSDYLPGLSSAETEHLCYL
jgi:hypothetical protein